MALRKHFQYGDVLSTDYGVYILDQTVDNSSEREYEAISIEGRSGDLHIDRNRFKNISLTYKCVIVKEAFRRYDSFISSLIAEGINKRIEDTIHEEYFRRGSLRGAVEPRVSKNRELFRFDLTFDCAPQKWLKIGEKAIAISGTKEVFNPTLYPAAPLIRVSGSGTIAIGGDRITVAEAADDMVIDCEMEDAYGSITGLSYNDRIELTGYEFPTIPSGNTTIQTTGCSIELVPRWFSI